MASSHPTRRRRTSATASTATSGAPSGRRAERTQPAARPANRRPSRWWAARASAILSGRALFDALREAEPERCRELDIELHDIQFQLCEFDKHERLRPMSGEEDKIQPPRRRPLAIDGWKYVAPYK